MRVKTVKTTYRCLEKTINSIGYEKILNILAVYKPDQEYISYTIIYEV